MLLVCLARCRTGQVHTKISMQNGVDKPKRLLQFVAFVHLPFSFMSLDLLCSFTLVYEGHFVLCLRQQILTSRGDVKRANQNTTIIERKLSPFWRKRLHCSIKLELRLFPWLRELLPKFTGLNHLILYVDFSKKKKAFSAKFEFNSNFFRNPYLRTIKVIKCPPYSSPHGNTNSNPTPNLQDKPNTKANSKVTTRWFTLD